MAGINGLTNGRHQWEFPDIKERPHQETPRIAVCYYTILCIRVKLCLQNTYGSGRGVAV
jgi:hypothetical protein